MLVSICLSSENSTYISKTSSGENTILVGKSWYLFASISWLNQLDHFLINRTFLDQQNLFKNFSLANMKWPCESEWFSLAAPFSVTFTKYSDSFGLLLKSKTNDRTSTKLKMCSVLSTSSVIIFSKIFNIIITRDIGIKWNELSFCFY